MTKFIASLTISELSFLIFGICFVSMLTITWFVKRRAMRKFELEKEKLLQKKHTDNDYFFQTHSRYSKAIDYYFGRKQYTQRKKRLKKQRIDRKRTLNHNNK